MSTVTVQKSAPASSITQAAAGALIAAVAGRTSVVPFQP